MRRVTPLLAATLAAGLAAAGCGDDDGERERERVRSAVARAIGGEDPGVCRELFTEAFLRKLTHRAGPAAVAECERERAPAAVDAGNIEDVEVSGDRASASATPDSGPVADDVLAVTLVRSGGDWRVDDLDRPSQADPAAAERAIVTAVLDYGSAAGAARCELLTYRHVRELGGESGCEARLGGRGPVNYQPGEATASGATATLEARDTSTGAGYRFGLARELGRWRIDTISREK